MKDFEPKVITRRDLLVRGGLTLAALFGTACLPQEPRTVIKYIDYPTPQIPTPTPTRTPEQIQFEEAREVVRSFLKGAFYANEGRGGIWYSNRKDVPDRNWPLLEGTPVTYNRFSIIPSGQSWIHVQDINLWSTTANSREPGNFVHLIKLALEENTNFPEIKYSTDGQIPAENLPLIVKKLFNVPEDARWSGGPGILWTPYRLQNGDYVSFSIKTNGSVEIAQLGWEPGL